MYSFHHCQSHSKIGNLKEISSLKTATTATLWHSSDSLACNTMVRWIDMVRWLNLHKLKMSCLETCISHEKANQWLLTVSGTRNLCCHLSITLSARCADEIDSMWVYVGTRTQEESLFAWSVLGQPLAFMASAALVYITVPLIWRYKQLICGMLAPSGLCTSLSILHERIVSAGQSMTMCRVSVPPNLKSCRYEFWCAQYRLALMPSQSDV